jgi:hypothetical protein
MSKIYFSEYCSVGRYYATSQKVASSRPDEVNSFNLQAALGPGIYPASTRNEYQKQKVVSDV